jgi:Fe-S oxidoreductase
MWKRRMQSPMFSGRGPKMGYTNLYEALKLHRGSVFAPAEPRPGMPCVLYFPGCGGALFYDRIGMSSILLLLKAGFAVAVPPRHLCCGFPLLAAGMDTAFEDNLAQNRQYLTSMLRNLVKQGFSVKHLATACGSCRDGLERMHMETLFPDLTIRDVGQIVLPLLRKEDIRAPLPEGAELIYHGACHCEWADVHKIKGQNQIVRALSDFSGAQVRLNPGCCGESGMGAVTSPQIYNLLRARKQERLGKDFEGGYQGPVVVGCPSCKIGIARCCINMHEKRPVLHVMEWLAGLLDGEDRRQSFRKKVNETRGDVRVVDVSAVTPGAAAEEAQEDEA